jgi:pimeloyl-ACP methyl ester carboxylesterase
MQTLANLRYDERGAGEAVYLVHAGMHSAWFGPLFDQPALDPFHVIRPVRPGYGGVPAPDEKASIAAHARSCGELLRELGVGRAHWVGHSSSCCMGLQLTLDSPELVASLILFEPARPSGKVREAHSGTYVAPAMKAAALGDVAGAFDLFLRVVGGDGYRDQMRQVIGDDGLVTAERESEYFFADEMPALGAWSFGPDEAAKVTVPALVVRGAETHPLFHENVEILAGMLPNGRIATLPGVTHLAPLTHPAVVATAIAEFVASVRG